MPSVCAYDESIRSFMEVPLDRLKGEIESGTTPLDFTFTAQDKVNFIASHREHIPRLLGMLSDHLDSDALFMPYDNGLLICFNEQRTTDNTTLHHEKINEFFDTTSSPETARNLFAALNVGVTMHEKEFGNNEFLSLTFPPELGMTKEIQTQWLAKQLSTFSSNLGASFDIYDTSIEPAVMPLMETLVLESADGDVKIQAAQTGYDEVIYVAHGVPMLRKPVAPGEGLLVNVLNYEDIPSYFFSIEDLPSILTSEQTLTSLSQTMLKAEGYGDIDLGFDPLSRKDNLRTFGLDDISDLTPEMLDSWDEEKKRNFFAKVLSPNETYAHPDVHFRNDISYVAALSRYGVTQHRSISLSQPTMERIDMWVDACRKAVKAGSLEELSEETQVSPLFGVGVLQRAPTDGKEHKVVTWELSATTNKPIFFIDLEKAKNWSSQKMLSEAIRAVSGLKTHLYKQAGKAYSQREDIFQMFGAVAQDDYLDIRAPLRKKLSGNLVGVRLTPDENSDARHLANMLMSWSWPEINFETYQAPDISENAVIVEAPELLATEPEILPPPEPAEVSIPITEMDFTDGDDDPFGWSTELGATEEPHPEVIENIQNEGVENTVEKVQGEVVEDGGLGEWWEDMESAFEAPPSPESHHPDDAHP